MALILRRDEVLTLFNASLDNARALFDAASHLALVYKEKNYPSLGLAELALEELGKSYSLLCLLSKVEQISDWTFFWREWKNHDLKAHRGFFYEFFCTIRVEIKSNDKIQLPLLPRGKFSNEKVASFYVDIDKSNRKIHVPSIEVTNQESILRIASLMGLFNSAQYVQDWLNSNESDDFKNAISDYAFVTITEEMYQQDVKRTLERLRTDNKDYNNALECIWNNFAPSGEEG